MAEKKDPRHPAATPQRQGYTILLVEDDPNIMEMTRALLERAGYAVLAADTLRKAAQLVAQPGADLVLLDVQMPDGSGLEFCRDMRRQSSTPVLFLTVQSQERDIVDGLLHGGDDYITKPYREEELCARIAAALRRVELDKKDAEPGGRLVRGPLTLDILAQRAYLGGKDILLSPKEFSLLLLLVRREGQYISKNELYETVWKQAINDDARALWVHLSRLRRKLEPEAEIRISGSRGEGYCFEVDGG